MKVTTKTIFLNAVLVAGLALGSTNVFADGPVPGTYDDGVCHYDNVVLNLAPFSNVFGTENTSVCIDVPVALKKVQVVFNIDNAGVDGNGQSNGLKHIRMLATAIKDRIAKGLVNPSDVSIVGIIHGSALPWALGANPVQNGLMNAIAGLKADGVNIQLEVCGVTLMGAHKTAADVYPGILVNQGAIGRLIDLEQQKYVYIHEV